MLGSAFFLQKNEKSRNETGVTELFIVKRQIQELQKSKKVKKFVCG
jgi:hypothetical protein